MNLDFKFNSDGLIPAIIQQTQNGKPTAGRVIMMAWMNRLALEKTIETGFMHYWSRSRQKLWFKGESSGHTQRVLRWYADCDVDALLFEVDQEGAACHTGHASCFYQSFGRDGSPEPITDPLIFDPEKVYSK